MIKKTMSVLLIAIILITASCKKKSNIKDPTDPRVPPKLDLKATVAYVFKDTTVVKQDTLLFGLTATKTEDNLTSLNGSVAYDGSTTTTTFYNHQMTSSQYTGFTVDVPYYTRNQAGTETLTFSVVDRDGNITKKTIIVTVI